MHEVSLAIGLLQLAEETCRTHGYKSIESIKVRLGRASGVHADSLSFALEALKKGTLAEKANFILDLIPLGGFCQDCGQNFETEETYVFYCPFCNSSSISICQGKELQIAEIEVA
ncbi:MAG: hydrogenase maturation nickel metallochaperone HypA [Thermodesulfobacteriota bacterium]